MKIDINKNDLWFVREILANSIWHMEHQPDPTAFWKMPAVARKMYKKIVKAQIKAFGHDWFAQKEYYPKGDHEHKVRIQE